MNHLDCNYDTADYLENFVECSCCGGEGIRLGKLGSLVYYRCQDCGITFSNTEN